MVRWLALVLCASAMCSARPQDPPPQGQLKTDRKPKAPSAGAKEAIPPEVDTAIAPTEYSFNPLQAEKDLKVGNYYWKQGKFRAAQARFREATRWNESFGAAWLRLGEAGEKLKDPKEAREAYTKYLELAADAKNASDIRKRLEKLK